MERKKDIRASMFVGKLENCFVFRFLRFISFVDKVKGDFVTRRWLSVSTGVFGS